MEIIALVRELGVYRLSPLKPAMGDRPDNSKTQTPQLTQFMAAIATEAIARLDGRATLTTKPPLGTGILRR